MKIDNEENEISQQQGVMFTLSSTTLCLLWYEVIMSVTYRWRNIVMIIPLINSILDTCTRLNVGIRSVGAQVGQESGPPPLLASNGKVIRRRDSTKTKNNLIKTISPKHSNPRFTHSIIISGANIVNLPVPGVGRDHIK